MVTIQALAQEQMELMVADKPQLEKLHTAGVSLFCFYSYTLGTYPNDDI